MEISICARRHCHPYTHIMASIIRRVARPAATAASRRQGLRAFSGISIPPPPFSQQSHAQYSQPTSWMPVPYVTETVVRLPLYSLPSALTANPGRRLENLGHLLAPPLRAHNHAQRRSKRPHVRHRHRPTPLPRSRQPVQTHLLVHKLARRQRNRGDGHLRHDELHPVPRNHNLHGASRIHGVVAARRRIPRPEVHLAAQQGYDSPAEWGV